MFQKNWFRLLIQISSMIVLSILANVALDVGGDLVAIFVFLSIGELFLFIAFDICKRRGIRVLWCIIGVPLVAITCVWGFVETMGRIGENPWRIAIGGAECLGGILCGMVYYKTRDFYDEDDPSPIWRVFVPCISFALAYGICVPLFYAIDKSPIFGGILGTALAGFVLYIIFKKKDKEKSYQRYTHKSYSGSTYAEDEVNSDNSEFFNQYEYERAAQSCVAELKGMSQLYSFGDSRVYWKSGPYVEFDEDSDDFLIKGKLGYIDVDYRIAQEECGRMESSVRSYADVIVDRQLSKYKYGGKSIGVFVDFTID